MIDALVIASGHGERARASRRSTPAPLVRVKGLELLERNLALLLRGGCASIAVSVMATDLELGAWARTRGVAVARSAGSTLTVFEEAKALGTIGVASRLRGADGVLVIDADNLITIDLAALSAQHRAVGAAFTVAMHTPPIPFGDAVFADGSLAAYHEKPELPVRVPSGAYVLGRDAIEALAPGARCGVPSLIARLLARGLRVGAFSHNAPCIAVTDVAAVARAEAYIEEHPQRFERHACDTSMAVVGAVLHDGDGVLVERRSASARCYAGLWDTPGGKVEPGECPDDAIARELDEELGVHPALRALAAFDDLDPTSGRVFRHHVYEATLPRGAACAREGQSLCWFDADALRTMDDVSTVTLRSLAWLKR